MKRALLTVAALGMLLVPAASAEAAERLVFMVSDGAKFQYDLELADPVGGGGERFVTGPGRAPTPIPEYPTWSHDDKTVAYQEGGSVGRGIVLKSVAGGGETTLIPTVASSGTGGSAPSWSPVSGEVAYWHLTGWQYWLKVISADGRTTRTLAGPFDQRTDSLYFGLEQPAWSPDGKTIAFSLRRSIYTVPAAGGPLRILVAGGPAQTSYTHAPSFAPDGRQLAYVRHIDNDPASLPWWLVVRDLESGQERVIANSDEGTIEHGSQSWSPDSKTLAFGENRVTGTNPITREGTINIARSNGTGRWPLLRRNFVGAPAWGSAAPSYYVKHIEVAQAISPDLPALDPVDPLASDPIEFQWKQPSVGGSTIPLVAGKSTLVRIYVGDASLASGGVEERDLRFTIKGAGLAAPMERQDRVKVTAPDVAPTQTDERAALNTWLPASAVSSGAPVSLEVEVNTGEAKTECGDCYPKGNKASLNGMLFQDGGSVQMAPVPIYVIAPDNTVIGPRNDFGAVLPAMTPMLPVGDSGAGVVPSPTIITVKPDDLTPDLLDYINPLTPLVTKEFACNVLLSLVEERRLMSPSVDAPGSLHWVGLTSHPLAQGACSGVGYQPGQSMLLTFPRPAVAVHELGHNLGLPHTLGYGSAVADGAVALPYIGIGGAGYEPFGGFLEVHDKLRYGDIMSYSPLAWTSPNSWVRMFAAILARSGGSPQPAGTSRAAAAAAPKKPRRRAGRHAMRTRRLVSGLIVGKQGYILRSLVADTAKPTNTGTVIGRIVARDERGRQITTLKIRGSRAAAGETPPFTVALPASERIKSLTLLPTTGTKPVDDLKASKHAPTGRLLRVPRRASAKRKLRLGWRASDRDSKEPTVMLLAKRGKSAWRTIGSGPARFKTSVDPRRLGKGRTLRLRLLISDGFNTTTTTTAPITLTRR